MNQSDIDKKQALIESIVSDMDRYDGMLKQYEQPRCPCCSETKNLTSGWSGGKLIHLCPAAAHEANNPRM